MPINYKLYPGNWPDIRKRILDRENNCCKTCKVQNGIYVFRGIWNNVEVFQTSDSSVYRLSDGEFITENPWACIDPSTGDPMQKAIRIVLTIAHLNHDIKDNRDENLAALCQLHHLRLDSHQHRISARETLKRKKGLIDLF
jgi:hypothetical protein